MFCFFLFFFFFCEVSKQERLHCLDDFVFEQSNNTAMLVPNTNTKARCIQNAHWSRQTIGWIAHEPHVLGAGTRVARRYYRRVLPLE